MTGKAELRAFLSWLLDFDKPGELASSARTFRRDTAWCWRIEVPPHHHRRWPLRW
jgi:hypothetical protein